MQIQPSTHSRDRHEHVGIRLHEDHIAHHHLHLLDGHALTHAQISDVREELRLPAVSEQGDEGLDLILMHVLLEQLAVVVHQSRDRVFGEDPVPDLTLHGAEEFVGYFFLKNEYNNNNNNNNDDDNNNSINNNNNKNQPRQLW